MTVFTAHIESRAVALIEFPSQRQRMICARVASFRRFILISILERVCMTQYNFLKISPGGRNSDRKWGYSGRQSCSS